MLTEQALHANSATSAAAALERYAAAGAADPRMDQLVAAFEEYLADGNLEMTSDMLIGAYVALSACAIRLPMRSNLPAEVHASVRGLLAETAHVVLRAGRASEVVR